MLGKELLQFIKSGNQPVVTFKERILDQEGYAEPGMRARITGIKKEDSDGCIVVHIDYTEFDEFNTAFESRNYYDKSQNPCLTAREAGFYKPQDTMWLDMEHEVDTTIEIEGDERIALFQEWNNELGGKTYIQWLEDNLLHLQERHSNLVNAF